MLGKFRARHWVIGAAMLAAADCAAVAAIGLFLTEPAQAQFRDDRYPVRRHVPRSGGFFQQLFGPYNPRHYERDDDRSSQQQQHTDHSRAPSSAKPEKDVTPTTTILVMGDGMADWLGYGLEDAFGDTPEVGIVRREKQRSGLLRYDAKGDLDWWHAVRDILTKEKANYVVMMIGLNDRDGIREKDLAKEDEKQKAEKEKAKNAAAKGEQKKDQPAGAQQPAQDTKQTADSDQDIIAPEPKGAVNGVIEFRTALWAKVYSRRIDETIAALKSKGVPVFWVGLPSIRGTKSTADAVYLNDLFRARAERAGINYIDVWDGFVDDSGKFTTFGPDYEGQTRKLRSADGVYFTKAGARKLAHYVEREIRRYMSNRALPVALPSGALTPAPEPGKPAARPVIGPVIPLTVTTGPTDQLLGTADSRPTYGDAIANDVLVKGESAHAQPGRADDFTWRPEDLAAAAAAEAAQANAAVSVKSGESAGDGKAGTKGAIRNVSPGKPGAETAKTKPAAKQAEAKGPPRRPNAAPASAR